MKKRRKKMKKIISFMLAVVLSAAMLTGCGEKAAAPETTGEATQQQAETTTTEEETAKSDVTLNVAMALGESEWDVMKNEVFALFTEQTGIKVNGIQVEHADMEGKVESLVKAGKAEIDVVAPDNMLLSGLVKKELIKDLSQYEELIPDRNSNKPLRRI